MLPLRWPCYLTNKCCSSPTWTGLDVDLFKKKNRSITVIARLNFDPINTSTGSLKLQTQNYRKYKYRCNSFSGEHVFRFVGHLFSISGETKSYQRNDIETKLNAV